MTDEIKQLLLDVLSRLVTFEEEWADYRAANRELTLKISELHATVQLIAPHASHLSQLPLIASSLRGLEAVNANHINSLIGSANANEQNKTKLIEKMMMICLVTVIFLGVLLIVLLVRETNSAVTVGASGLKITANEKVKDERETHIEKRTDGMP